MSVPSLGALDPVALAIALDVPRIVHRARVTSTMDEAHRLAAAGAEAGTLVIADEQTAGRGRGGRRWASSAAHGVWLTMIERPDSPSGLDVLSLRVGLAAAPVLERLGNLAIALKWPNDLYVGPRKLAGVLIEARWRDDRPDWVAIGIGVNLVPPPGIPGAVGIGGDVTRADVLAVLVPALRVAAAARGPLSPRELGDFGRRDAARGRRTDAPAAGVAQGITSDGALIIESASGTAHYRGGSLLFAGEAP